MEPALNRLRLTPSAVALLAANLVPLLGVMFAGWSLLEVVALYWIENLVIGGINVLKMATSAPDPEYLLEREQNILTGELGPPKPPSPHTAVTTAGHHLVKLLFIPFFAFHYGMFCMVHGVFIFALLGDQGPFGLGQGPFGGLQQEVLALLSGGTLIAILGLIGSHLFSYGYHFLYRGEFRRTNVGLLMMAPYGRIVVLHVAILFGAFATHLLGQPMILLILLIIGKTMLDWTMHQRVHRALGDETVLHTVPGQTGGPQ
jgi:hypothetical protein